MSELPSYPREAAEREESAGPSEPAQLALAGWWSRVGAYFLDVIVLVAPLVVMFGVLFALDPDDDSGVWVVVALLYVAALVLPFVYFTVLHGNERGQTVGKRALGIRVVNAETGGPIGYGSALARYFVVALLGIFVVPLIVDYLWPLFDSKNQSLHDKAVKSLVVRVG